MDGQCVQRRVIADEQMRGITINAAEVLGVSDRIGAVKPGLDADFSLYADDPISMMTRPVLVAVRGMIAVDRRR